jgi:hypothetical protein
MESLGRALAVKPAVAFWGTLSKLYLAAQGPREEAGLAAALAASVTADHLDELIGLLREDTRGDSRILFLRPILRLGRERGRELVEALQSDELFGREARALLSKRKRRPAR